MNIEIVYLVYAHHSNYIFFKSELKDGQYMLGKIMEYMFGGFVIIFTGILMIAIIALIVCLIIDFIKK